MKFDNHFYATFTNTCFNYFRRSARANVGGKVQNVGGLHLQLRLVNWTLLLMANVVLVTIL